MDGYGFRQKIPLHNQLTDLGVKLGDLAIPALVSLGALLGEHLGEIFDRLALPGRDLRRLVRLCFASSVPVSSPLIPASSATLALNSAVSIAEPGSEADDDRSRSSTALDRAPVQWASINSPSFYRGPTADNEETLRLMRLIDEQFLETPWYGSRQMARHLRRNGWCVGRHRVRRLMLKMGLAPIYQRPKTSEPHPQHRIWPYLRRHLTIDRPNQNWLERPLSRCAEASCTWSRSWTGSAARFWRGGCQARWMPRVLCDGAGGGHRPLRQT